MSLFWLYTLTMVVIALFILLLSLRANTQGKTIDYNMVNLALTRSRLRELQQEQAQALLTSSSREQAEDELKLALSHELTETTEGQAVQSASLLRYLLISLAVVVVAVFASSSIKVSQFDELLGWDNAMQRLPELGRRVVMQNDPSVTREDLTDFALGLRTRLQQNPNDAIGWLLFGRVNVALSRVTEGLAAYEKSLAIDPQHLGTTVSYSQALLMTSVEENLDRAYALLSAQLRINPNSTDFDLLSLHGVAATAVKQPAQAIASWQRLLQILPEADPRYSSVQQQLQRLTTEAIGFTVTIDVSKDLPLPESGYLFLFAQSRDTGNMPLAVVKQPITAFPITINLTASDAMVAQLAMTVGQTVTLTARLSSDETIDVGEGDLQGQQADLVVPNRLNPLNLIIDQRLGENKQ